jgi:5-methyltetrahydrofolate--homocysteine methyltransferase
MLLDADGFSVFDLGVDVSAEAFVRAAREHAADIIALSALLTTTMPQFRVVLDALSAAGLRPGVKVMVGGAAVSRSFADQQSVEGFAEDCVAAVDEARRLMTSKRS